MVLTLIAICAVFSQVQGGQPDNKLHGTYFGQTPPGMNAELFAPGIVCTGLADRDISISPDGREVYWAVLEEPHYTLVHIRRHDNGSWGERMVVPFSGRYNDIEPAFSPDGTRLYFASNRPLNGQGKPKDYDIWYVEREGDKWGKPFNPGAPLNTEKDEFYPSVTNSGTVYFTTHDMKIARSA